MARDHVATWNMTDRNQITAEDGGDEVDGNAKHDLRGKFTPKIKFLQN